MQEIPQTAQTTADSNPKENKDSGNAQENPFMQMISPERLLQIGILVTRIGFIIILVMCLMMKGEHLVHFVVLFFITFGLNCSMLYYRGLLNRSKEQIEDDKKEA